MAEKVLSTRKQLIGLIVKGYAIGTLAAAFALHIAISIIAPGDGGTMLALGSGIIFFMLIVVLGIIALVAFPLAALVSWPLRDLVIRNPVLASALAIGVGLATGAILTAIEFQVGPGDFWSGPIVGAVYGAVWFLVVRRAAIRELDA